MVQFYEKNYYLRKWNDSSLRQKCLPVKDFSKLHELKNYMNHFLSTHDAYGLAAPQVGDNRQVILSTTKGLIPEFFINPEIINRKGTIFSLEPV